MRGRLHAFGLAESPPHLARRADLSPQAGRGKKETTRRKAGIAPGLSFFSGCHAPRERGIQSPQPWAREPIGRGGPDRPDKPDDDARGITSPRRAWAGL